MLHAGRLKQRITLLSPGRSKDPVTREVSVSWNIEAEVWATVEPISAKRAEAAKQIFESVNAEVWIRYTPDLTPEPKWAVYYRGKKYEVGAVINEHEANVSYRLLCGPAEAFTLPS